MLLIRCSKHPSFKAVNTPNACHACWTVWEVKRELSRGNLLGPEQDVIETEEVAHTKQARLRSKKES